MWIAGRVIEVASVINLSEASGRVAAGFHPPTIDTLVTGMGLLTIEETMSSKNIVDDEDIFVAE